MAINHKTAIFHKGLGKGRHSWRYASRKVSRRSVLKRGTSKLHGHFEDVSVRVGGSHCCNNNLSHISRADRKDSGQRALPFSAPTTQKTHQHNFGLSRFDGVFGQYCLIL